MKEKQQIDYCKLQDEYFPWCNLKSLNYLAIRIISIVWVSNQNENCFIKIVGERVQGGRPP